MASPNWLNKALGCASPRPEKMNRNSFLNCDTVIIICLTLNQLSRLGRLRSRVLLLKLSGIIVVVLLLVVILLLVVVELLRLLLVELVALLLLAVRLLALLLADDLALALSIILQVEVVLLGLDVELALVLLCEPLLFLLEPARPLVSVKRARGHLGQLLLEVSQKSAYILRQS